MGVWGVEIDVPYAFKQIVVGVGKTVVVLYFKCWKKILNKVSKLNGKNRKINCLLDTKICNIRKAQFLDKKVSIFETN